MGLNMGRREDLEKLVINGDKDMEIKAGRLIDEVIFLEEQMARLRQYPFIETSDKFPGRTKASAASKQYKEFLQQYNNSLRVLFWLTGGIEENEQESPLRLWAKSREGS